MSSPTPLPAFEPATFGLTDFPGIRCAGVRSGLKASGLPDIGLLVSEVPLTAAAIFTQNHFAAAPVLLSRAHLQRSQGHVRAIVVNSGNANACTGLQGERTALAMCQRVAAALKCPEDQVLVCSTGIIGVPLDIDKVNRGIDLALSELSASPEHSRAFLESIMTTDAFAKSASGRFGDVSIAGVCKGAGMIQPNMATMLAFVLCDADIRAEQLKRAMPRIAAQSFNAVHVDSHTSTNDSFVILSTRRIKTGPGWEHPLIEVSQRLAWLIARDGEGATKVTKIVVTGAANEESAREVALSVATSALVRTALFGNDPNWGRFVSQIGNVKSIRNPKGVSCTLQGIDVFRNGEPVAFDRAKAAAAMAQENVTLGIQLQDGPAQGLLMTSDLGHRYIDVNAHYST